MTDTELAEQIIEMIDTTAPPVSVDAIIARGRAVAVAPDSPARRSRLSPVLVLSYCAMAVLLTVAVVVGVSVSHGSGPSKSPSATAPITPATRGSLPGQPTVGDLHFADVAATPVNWSPIIYGNVQISVPSDWAVYAGDNCTGDTGVVLAVPVNESGCANAPDEAEIGDFVPPTGPYSLKSNGSVNTIPVATEPSSGGASFEVALGMFVRARGPLATEILGTLTYAPDYSILQKPSIFIKPGTLSAPDSWQTVTFGGITFRSPAGWTTERDSGWGGCPGNIQADVIRLSTAQGDIAIPTCPVTLLTASAWTAVPGVVVGAGPAVFDGAIPDTTGDQCRTMNGLRVCIEPVPLDSGSEPGLQLNLLTALVFVPGQTRPDQVEIGLAGSGQVPDAIFDSMRPAGSSS
jgi:hypothetical protein